ncbi:PREDICTED: uncharacterized protein LOC109468037 [Branchiostoma belcheri]|uniref:Uncharacterized protein LOC109468037 n=1 Tax=Branchiostoma belcheri TaxID=7741 RepID=A0A6P4YT80_BRABE|nr:PREDICTED: uncharacterized protein LOC109468037 [Branchiostoma belcheri]XP_019621817.1 PREDICTED: uncharacterized protein LOC109468037 [Branchiostoma belcheri]
MADITFSEMMGGSVCKPKPEGDTLSAFFAGVFSDGLVPLWDGRGKSLSVQLKLGVGKSSFLNDPLKLQLQDRLLQRTSLREIVKEDTSWIWQNASITILCGAGDSG